jgi:hypothetical protein
MEALQCGDVHLQRWDKASSSRTMADPNYGSVIGVIVQ